MLGLMQDYPLLVQTVLDHAALNHGEQEMVTRSIEGPIRRYTYRDLRTRALRVAKALAWVTGLPPWPGIQTVIWKPGMESWGLVQSAIHSTRVYSPSSSFTSSTTRKTKSCL